MNELNETRKEIYAGNSDDVSGFGGLRVRTHSLKTWPVYFEAVLSGEKTFEIRENDRSFQRGDVLHLQEWDPEVAKEVHVDGQPQPYTGRECRVRVTYVTTFAQKKGFVVMAIGRLNAKAES